MYNSLVFVFFVSSILEQGESIRCYMCHSETNASCTDGSALTSKFTTTRCSFDLIPKKTRDLLQIYSRDDPVYYSCIKYVVVENQTKTVTRDCTRSKTRYFDPCYVYKASVENAATITKKNLSVMSCEVCTTDGCNGGMSAALSSSLNSVLLACLLILSVRLSVLS